MDFFTFQTNCGWCALYFEKHLGVWQFQFCSVLAKQGCLQPILFYSVLDGQPAFSEHLKGCFLNIYVNQCSGYIKKHTFFLCQICFCSCVYYIYIFEFYFVWVLAFLSVWLQDFDFCSLVFELLSGTMSIGSYAISTSVCSIHLFLSFFLCSIHQRDPPNLWYWILVWEVDVMVLFLFFWLMLLVFRSVQVHSLLLKQLVTHRLQLDAWFACTYQFGEVEPFSASCEPQREKKTLSWMQVVLSFFLLILIDDLWKSRGLHSVSACGCSTE